MDHDPTSIEPGDECKPAIVRCIVLWFVFGLFVYGLASDAWLARHPRYAFRGLLYVEFDWFSVFAGLTGMVAIWQSTRRLSWFTIGCAAVLVASLVGARTAVVQYQAPFYAAFSASRTELDSLVAETLERGQPDVHRVDRNVGVFHVTTAQTIGEAVVLRLDDEEHTVWSSHAFVYAPNAEIDDIDEGVHGLHGAFVIRVGGDWFLAASVYNLLKTGWS